MTASRQPERTQDVVEHPDVELLERLEALLQLGAPPASTIQAVLAAVREAKTEDYVRDRYRVLDEFAVEDRRGDLHVASTRLVTAQHHLQYHHGGHVVERTSWTTGWVRRGQ